MFCKRLSAVDTSPQSMIATPPTWSDDGRPKRRVGASAVRFRENGAQFSKQGFDQLANSPTLTSPDFRAQFIAGLFQGEEAVLQHEDGQHRQAMKRVAVAQFIGYALGFPQATTGCIPFKRQIS